MEARVNLPVDRQRVAAFCRKWSIVEFALFGSVLRDDFRPESDVDVLVRFAPDVRWGLFDLVRMEQELEQVFGRRVDLVERESVERSENYIRKQHVLQSLESIYVA
jgi:predicted nucleotidyltransferase